CYDCPPHDQGMATFRRLGIETTCRTRHYARPLQATRQVERRLGSGAIAGVVTAAANRVLAVSTAARRHAQPGVEISEHGGRFGEEFTALDRAAGGAEVVRSRRSMEDLNWRYRDDPLHRYRVLTARRQGELEAFVVFAATGDDVEIVDLFGHVSRDLAVSLLAAAA